MAQQLINVGAAANDRTGDTWRAAFQKVNSNETELFDFKNANAFIFIAQESEFPVQDSTTITLTSNDVFVVSASFTTAKRFICEDGSLLTMFNAFGHVLTYSGSGTMFTGVDVNFNLLKIRISCPNANVFNFEETIGDLKALICKNTVIESSFKAGIFDSMTVQMDSVLYANTTNGIDIIGTDVFVTLLEAVSIISISPTIKHIDLGTATLQNPNFNNLFLVGPPSAVGISGLTNSGNVVSGVIGKVTNSSFVGGMTDLSGLTPDDIRWLFQNNSPTRDSFADALLSFRNNVTATVISASSTDGSNAVIVNATWIVNQFSQFTVTTGGRATYNAERDFPGSISVSAGLISDGGGGIDATLYIAVNGSVIIDSGVKISISGSNSQTLSIPWQEVLSESDFVEIFVENNTNTTNIIVEYATIRIE